MAKPAEAVATALAIRVITSATANVVKVIDRKFVAHVALPLRRCALLISDYVGR